MKYLLTLLAQTTIDAPNDEAYQRKRDKIMRRLESQGFSLSVENEGGGEWEEEDRDTEEDEEEEEPKIKDHYFNGECPDCGEPIPSDMVDGGECHNCGHVFYAPRDND